MKKTLLKMAAGVVSLFMFTACNAAVSSTNLNARDISVEIKNAEKETNSELGRLVVEQGKNVMMNASLSSGAVDVTIYEIASSTRDEDGDEEYEKGEALSVSHLEGESNTLTEISPGEYLVELDVTETASGTIHINIQ